MQVQLEQITTDLALPVSVIPLDPAGSRLLVTQLAGTMVVVENGTLREAPFLSLPHRVTGLRGEQGLFSAALESAAAAEAAGRDRLLVVAYTERDTDDLIISTFPTDPALTSADPDGETVLLRVEMPEPFHHGGQVAFGPDGMLYVSIGNGERSNSFLHQQPASAQSLASLRGKLLRIDLTPSGELPYSIPSDNPFAAGAAGSSAAFAAGGGAVVGQAEGDVRQEIYATGLRNPWKFSFDEPSGWLLVADVGEDRWEEISLVAAGDNLGWPAREGRECLAFPDAPGLVEPNCRKLKLTDPLIAYPHLDLDPAGGLAVVGGVMVSDPELGALVGRYLFGDFVLGKLWSYDPVSGRIELLLTEDDFRISAIAAGANGQVLILSMEGSLSRLVLVE